MPNWFGVALVVTGITLYCVVYIAVGVAGLTAWFEQFYARAAVLFLLLFLMTVIPLTIVFTWPSGDDSTHGSCKYEHWQSSGKTSGYVCDEYYPPPRVIQPNG